MTTVHLVQPDFIWEDRAANHAQAKQLVAAASSPSAPKPATPPPPTT